MEYNEKEKQVLALMERTDFKNLNKNEVVSFISNLADLRPEVALEIIKQFPEFAKLATNALSEYKDMLTKVIESDDASIEKVYQTSDKVLDQTKEDSREYYKFAEDVRSDISKCLGEPNLSNEERIALIDREMEIFKAVNDKDKERFEKREKVLEIVDKKDSEKRQFNWGLVKTASGVLLVVLGVSATMLGNSAEFKLPNFKK